MRVFILSDGKKAQGWCVCDPIRDLVNWPKGPELLTQVVDGPVVDDMLSYLGDLLIGGVLGFEGVPHGDCLVWEV